MVDSEASSIARDSERLRAMLVGFSPQACSTPAVRQQGTIPDNCSDMKRRVRLFINASAERTAVLTRAFIAELRAIINAMASMPTKRTLVLISDGFDLVPGRELYGIASAYFPNDGEWRINERESQTELKGLLRMAQRNDVIVYALDSRGLYTPAASGLGDASQRGDGYWTSGLAMQEMTRDEDRVAWQNGSAMAQLASATGGIYFHNNNNLLAGIRKAFNDERERYVLAYAPENEVMDGGYRKIRVEVKGKDLRAHAKTGYWAAGN
jgi:VWFA-related protein